MLARLSASLLLAAAGLTACTDSAEPAEPFALRFAAVADGREVGCTDDLGGFGPSGTDHVGLNDLRFYVSNVKFLDADGAAVELTLDSDDFQYASADGAVALIDLTSNTEGSCNTSAVDFAEGTARTHAALTGKTQLARVDRISFDVGVPQRVMKTTIANTTAEGAPSPLNEMYWSWNSGYRHFVMNFAVTNGAGDTGAGYVHVGSIGCAPDDGSKALSDRESCTFVNTPTVSLTGFDLATNTVAIDLRALAQGLDFISPIYDPVTFEIIGQGPGVECHSSPDQPDCPTIFAGFGVDITSGQATAATDRVFQKR